jgi:hypothetical protein
MLSLTKLSENFKVIVPIAVGIFVILVVTILIFSRESAHSWRGVTPGETTSEGLKRILGTPKESGNVGNGGITLSKYVVKADEAKIYIKGNRVALIKVRSNGDPPEDFGEEGATVYSPDYEGFKILLYSTKGRGEVINELYGNVFEQWYFKPAGLVNIKAEISQINKLQDKKAVVY